MRLCKKVLLSLALTCGVAPAATGGEPIGIGKKVAPDELTNFFAIPPSGRGLPPGRGTAERGMHLYRERCAMCHGEQLEGDTESGADTLIGGRGSLSGPNPKKTVESYWPYATTLFDYIKRTMPFQEPGTLSNDEVYSLVAYILAESKIITRDKTMDAESLPKIRMPNRDGFELDSVQP